MQGRLQRERGLDRTPGQQLRNAVRRPVPRASRRHARVLPRPCNAIRPLDRPELTVGEGGRTRPTQAPGGCLFARNTHQQRGSGFASRNVGRQRSPKARRDFLEQRAGGRHSHGRRLGALLFPGTIPAAKTSNTPLHTQPRGIILAPLAPDPCHTPPRPSPGAGDPPWSTVSGPASTAPTR